MRPQASLKRSETSRRKIQSRFSVFTTSSQNKNPAPSVNPGTKQLWLTHCDTSANDEVSETNIWLHQQWSTSETNSDGSQPTMKTQKHLTSSTYDASETPIWHHPPCWPRQYLTATTIKSRKQSDFTDKWSPDRHISDNKHTSESLTPFKRQHCQLMSP